MAEFVMQEFWIPLVGICSEIPKKIPPPSINQFKVDSSILIDEESVINSRADGNNPFRNASN